MMMIMIVIMNKNKIISPTAVNDTGYGRSHPEITMLSLLTHYQSLYMGMIRKEIILCSIIISMICGS